MSIHNIVNNALKLLRTYLIISAFVSCFTVWGVVFWVKCTRCVLLRTSFCKYSTVSYFASTSEYWQRTILL